MLELHFRKAAEATWYKHPTHHYTAEALQGIALKHGFTNYRIIDSDSEVPVLQYVYAIRRLGR